VKITYDSKADALYIKFQEGSVGKTKKIEEGILIDLDQEGHIYGIEIIGVSERMPLAELGRISLELPVSG
jgi:uncharacterized protein YuzE